MGFWSQILYWDNAIDYNFGWEFWLGILVGNNGDFGHKFGLETMPLVTNFDFHFPRMTLDDLNGCQPLSSRWLKRRSVEIIV